MQSYFVFAYSSKYRTRLVVAECRYKLLANMTCVPDPFARYLTTHDWDWNESPDICEMTIVSVIVTVLWLCSSQRSGLRIVSCSTNSRIQHVVNHQIRQQQVHSRKIGIHVRTCVYSYVVRDGTSRNILDYEFYRSKEKDWKWNFMEYIWRNIILQIEDFTSNLIIFFVDRPLIHTSWRTKVSRSEFLVISFWDIFLRTVCVWHWIVNRINFYVWNTSYFMGSYWPIAMILRNINCKLNFCSILLNMYNRISKVIFSR